MGRADVAVEECFYCLDCPNSFFFFFKNFCPVVGDGLVKPEALNKKAIQIINRVRDKLTGEHVFMFM